MSVQSFMTIFQSVPFDFNLMTDNLLEQCRTEQVVYDPQSHPAATLTKFCRTASGEHQCYATGPGSSEAASIPLVNVCKD